MKRTFIALSLLLPLAAGCNQTGGGGMQTPPPPAAETAEQNSTEPPLAAVDDQTTVAPIPAPPTQTAPVPTGSSPQPMLPRLDQAQTDTAGYQFRTSQAGRISVQEAAQLMQSGQAIVLDVRGDEAYEAAHIRGSHSVPLNLLADRAPAIIEPGKKIITYCT